MLEENDLIKEYKEILNGTRKRFTRNTWKSNQEEKAKIVMKYLFEEILKWDTDKIMSDLNYEIISKYKLTTIYDTVYNSSVGNIIKLVYPNVLTSKKIPVSKKTRMKLSIAHKNLSKEKRDNILKGMRENRYCKEYAKKLSDTKLGELNPQHKLKAEQVRKIKIMWKAGNHTCSTLGDMFGVKRQTIADIVYDRTWKNV